MKKPTYEEQNVWLSKYVAPAFLDLNFGPIIDATVKPLWEKYVTIPKEISANRKPEVKKEMEEAGVYKSLQNLELEDSMGGKFKRILMGDVPENEKPMSMVGDVRGYINTNQFAVDVGTLDLELKKKPLEVLEGRINREIMSWAQRLTENDSEMDFRREYLIKTLLTQYNKRVKPEDRDPLIAVHAQVFAKLFGLTELGRESSYNIYNMDLGGLI